MQIITAFVEQRLDELATRDLAALAWSFAKLDQGGGSRTFMATLAGAVADRMPELAVQDAVNVAWSFATVQAQQQPLMWQLGVTIYAHVGELNAQDLSNTVWSLA
eukprot:TRINITY_DN82551_c0_g1_i1.p1 TRINITY_DN82551_c0_g1~~TRINITY_DN82551_c0_g1_i1.p1  ORF type:complete len:105 (-),score=21.36 TRINITY_DN82551_c0_g1_i1:82-396(-)